MPEDVTTEESPEARLREVLGHRYELVATELQHVGSSLAEIGVEGTELTLFGSAVKGKLRTREDDPDDPSDLDILAVLPDDEFATLGQLFRDGAPLSRTRSVNGAPSYLAKISSATGHLAPAEVEIYSQTGLALERSGANPAEKRTELVTNAGRDGINVTALATPKEVQR